MKLPLQAAVLVLATTLPSGAAVMTWFANLTPEQELHTVMLNGNTPSGFGTVEFDDSTNLLTIDFNWSGLTGEATAAHIHCCVATPPGTAGVALGFWNPPAGPARPSAGNFNMSWDLDTENPFTSATFVTNNGGTPLLAFTTGLVPAMNAGNRAYFNIHTEMNPAGEIRGNISPVPEPSTALIFLSGIGLIALSRLRK